MEEGGVGEGGCTQGLVMWYFQGWLMITIEADILDFLRVWAIYVLGKVDADVGFVQFEHFQDQIWCNVFSYFRIFFSVVKLDKVLSISWQIML